MSEEKTQEDVKAETEKVDKETIPLVVGMSIQDKDEFYAWLKYVYGVDDPGPLSIKEKREVLEHVKKIAEKREDKT